MAAKNTGFVTDAVSNRLRELNAEREKLFRDISKCDIEIYKLSNMSEEERDSCIDLDINLFPDIPTRIKTILTNYGEKNHWPKPVTVRFILNKGKKEIEKIRGIGFWSIVDLDKFFLTKGYDWK